MLPSPSKPVVESRDKYMVAKSMSVEDTLMMIEARKRTDWGQIKKEKKIDASKC